MKNIFNNPEKWPTLPQALKARAEADIVRKQGIGLFLSDPVQFVFQALENKRSENNCCGEFSNHIAMLEAFNYGYILGKRAERAKRR